MIETVSDILNRCNSTSANISPTILYNEGWMTRLLVEVSIDAGISLRGIEFGNIRHWYSEGLLSSPFLPRYRGDILGEGYTHADMALGDLVVDPSNRGDVSVKGAGGTFGVIEAKMGSQLSACTKNAPDYDQASRNLACVAFNTLSTRHKIFFAVAAPQQIIQKYNFEEKLSVSGMVPKIAKRFEMYDSNSKVHALKERVLERARTCVCFALSYESWIDVLAGHELQSPLNEFMKQCYRFNRIG